MLMTVYNNDICYNIAANARVLIAEKSHYRWPAGALSLLTCHNKFVPSKKIIGSTMMFIIDGILFMSYIPSFLALVLNISANI